MPLCELCSMRIAWSQVIADACSIILLVALVTASWSFSAASWFARPSSSTIFCFQTGIVSVLQVESFIAVGNDARRLRDILLARRDVEVQLGDCGARFLEQNVE